MTTTVQFPVVRLALAAAADDCDSLQRVISGFRYIADVILALVTVGE